jgi:hypothetical protein
MSRLRIRSVARILSKGSGASQEEEHKAVETKGALAVVVEDNKLEVLAIFLRNSRKCSVVVAAVARVVAATGIHKCRDQKEPISRLTSTSISWKLSKEPRKQSRSIGLMLAPLVKAPSANQVLPLQHVGVVEVKVSRRFVKVPS